jgi:CBS domain-containing protein
MKDLKVKDLMIQLAEYAAVSEEATLHEAVFVLEKVQQKFDEHHYKHRAILVFNFDGDIIGKVSQTGILRCLDSAPGHTKDMRVVRRFGFSSGFVESNQETYGHLKDPLDDLCRKSASTKVKDIMSTPGEGEYISADANLSDAIHQLAKGHYLSLLATSKDEVVGVLRLSDVFNEVSKVIKKCQG